jgi:hypothetical protein
MGSREERKRRDADEAEELVALMDVFRAMTAGERLAQAHRLDLTESEQLVLATFADDAELAAVLLSHPGLCDAAKGVASATQRHSGPWWRRLFRL